MSIYKKEIDMYEDIIISISETFDLYGYKYSVYKTWKEFSQEFKNEFPNETSILEKSALPDLFILYEDKKLIKHKLIIEVKIDDLTVVNIGQAKIYCDIFNADLVLLVSLKPIRSSFISFNNINKNFLLCNNGTCIHTCILNEKSRRLELQNCFPPVGRFII